MIGNVGGEVGWGAVAPDDYVVLVLSQGCGHEPSGALPLYKVVVAAQGVHGSLVLPAIVEGVLPEPHVETYPQVLQIVSDVLKHPIQADMANLVHGLLDRHGQEAVSLLLRNVLCQLDHVVAHVPALGHLRVSTQGLLVPDVEGVVEGLHLASGVVDVVLPGDVVAGGGEDRRQGISQHRAPGVAHVNGACGVYAHELHLDPLTLAQINVAVLVPLRNYALQLGCQPCGCEGEVDEAGRFGPHPLHRVSGEE